MAAIRGLSAVRPVRLLLGRGFDLVEQVEEHLFGD